MAGEKGSSNALFENGVFAIVINRDLPKNQAVELRKTLEDHAGKVLDFEGGAIDIGEITHIISATSDFPEYAEARLHMIPVLTPLWITTSLIKNKEALMRPFSPDPKLIFSNVVISCADIPQGDKDAIIGAVLAMGGSETSSLTRQTTHICALSLDHPKCQSAIEKKLKCQIVLPHWFDDCLKLGKRIDEKPYLLPDPEVLRLNPEDPLPVPQNDDVVGASSPRPENLPVPTDSPSRRLTVFKDKKIRISADLDLGSRLLKVIEDLIIGGGGSMTNLVHNADMFVCHWRAGRDYVFASRSGIDVGNLSWLYYLIANNEWTSPLRRLLHYPLPQGGIEGFKDFRITLSNYGGEARTYLENLVEAAGGEYTKSMKQDNTHLITARNNSEKCVAAAEWGIEMVNHLWIEESYAKCEVQKLTDLRYTHFPPRTNLGEIIGRTQFDREVLEPLYFARDPTPSPSDPKALRKPIMHEKDRNASSRLENNDVSMTEGDDSFVAPATEKKKRARTRQSLPAVVTPAPNRRFSAGKENDTPSSTGSRRAKDKALSMIQVNATDIALYEKEKKRKGQVWGGDRAANRIEKEMSAERSSSPVRKPEEEEYSEDEEDEAADKRKHKRQKTAAPPQVVMRLMITGGYKSWLNNPNKEDTDKKKLRDLGILVVSDPKTCTHLAAPKMVRTQKFLCSLAAGPEIVSTDFIDQCLSKNAKLPSVEDFQLKDPENEKKHGVKLKDAISRAKANKRMLLRRVPIYCTENIKNGPAIFKAIVEANGGVFAIYTGRPVIKKTSPEEDEGSVDPVYLLTGYSTKEKGLWPKFEQMAKEGNMEPRVVDSEWLLDCAMSQQHKWHKKFLAVNNKPDSSSQGR